MRSLFCCLCSAFTLFLVSNVWVIFNHNTTDYVFAQNFCGLPHRYVCDTIHFKRSLTLLTSSICSVTFCIVYIFSQLLLTLVVSIRKSFTCCGFSKMWWTALLINLISSEWRICPSHQSLQFIPNSSHHLFPLFFSNETVLNPSGVKPLVRPGYRRDESLCYFQTDVTFLNDFTLVSCRYNNCNTGNV